MKKFNINTPNIEEIIHQYLNGQLAEKDVSAFEQALTDDENLKAEVLLVKALKNNLKEKRRSDTKSLLQNITAGLDVEGDEAQLEALEQRINKKKKTSSSFAPKIITIGFAIFLAIMLLWLFLPYTPTSKDFQEVYKDYYVPFQLVEFVDSKSTKTSDKGLFAYSLKDYPSVIQHLKSLGRYTSEMDLMMALGIAYIETNDLANAEKTLTVVSKDTRDIYAEDAQWYLSLILLKQGQVDRVRQYLTPLMDHDVYGKSAKEILDRIPDNRYQKYFK